jgi:lipid-A-disaccharide synthase
MTCVLITALEASGDALGAEFMQALRRKLGEDVRFIGIGGPLMQAQGLASAFDIRELSIVGLVEGLFAFRRAARRARQLAEMAARERPDIAVLIDSWGFSYLLAKQLRRRLPRLPLVKFVAPQVWATRPERAKALAETFDHLLSIIAFEVPIFEAAGAPTTFVGHPGLAHDFSHADAERLRRRIDAAPDDPILLVLPGSRPSEIERLMPSFEEAVGLLKAQRPALQVVVLVAATVADEVRRRTAAWPFRVHLIDNATGRDDAMVAADVALACSGTVTTELAAAGCPMVVAYRLGPLTYRIAKRIVRTRFITLFNIAADAAVAPELIQDACTGPNLARELALRLDNPQFRAEQARAQMKALESLGGPGAHPAERAAEVVAGLLAEEATSPR